MSLSITEVNAPITISPNKPFKVEARLKGNTLYPVRLSVHTVDRDFITDRVVNGPGLVDITVTIEEFPLHKRKAQFLVKAYDRLDHITVSYSFTTSLKRK